MNWWVINIKKVCATLNYFQNFVILASVVTQCISISAFTSLIGTPIRITCSDIGTKICVTARIKMYKSIIKKKKNKHNKIVLFAKSKLNSTVVF